MNPRNAVIALVLLLVGLVLQTTLFTVVKPFGVSPNLLLVLVVATARHLTPEPAVLAGFTAGVLADLLSDTPLGLWALSLTVVAYMAMRLHARWADNPAAIAGGIVLLTLVGEGLFVVIGTLFGASILSDALVVRKLLLTPVYNLILGIVVVPGVALAITAQRRRGWAL